MSIFTLHAELLKAISSKEIVGRGSAGGVHVDRDDLDVDAGT